MQLKDVCQIMAYLECQKLECAGDRSQYERRCRLALEDEGSPCEIIVLTEPHGLWLLGLMNDMPMAQDIMNDLPIEEESIEEPISQPLNHRRTEVASTGQYRPDEIMSSFGALSLDEEVELTIVPISANNHLLLPDDRSSDSLAKFFQVGKEVVLEWSSQESSVYIHSPNLANRLKIRKRINDILDTFQSQRLPLKEPPAKRRPTFSHVREQLLSQEQCLALPPGKSNSQLALFFKVNPQLVEIQLDSGTGCLSISSNSQSHALQAHQTIRKWSKGVKSLALQSPKKTLQMQKGSSRGTQSSSTFGIQSFQKKWLEKDQKELERVQQEYDVAVVLSSTDILVTGLLASEACNSLRSLIENLCQFELPPMSKDQLELILEDAADTNCLKIGNRLVGKASDIMQMESFCREFLSLS